MSTITLPNIRVSSDLTVRVRLKDGGVAIDWSTLTKIKASIYSDAQRALAGRCDVSIDAEDSTLLVCSYAANKPQYVGVNRIVVSAKYMGETKTYDKPAFNFVRWTADQEGEQITIDDPDVDVEIDVEDISSSILQEAVEAAFEAADRANDAAAAAEHMVDIHTGPEGKSAYEVAVEEGYVGTEEEWLASLVGPQGPQGIQGETGEAAGFGTASASLTEDGGAPGVTVAASGSDTAKNFAFTFKNLKGDKGDKGDQGNTGSSVEYPYELVNNLTTNDATKGLTAAMGVTLEGQVSQLEAKVDDLSTGKYYGYFAKEEDLPEADVDGFAYVGEGPTYTIYNLRSGVWTSSDITVNQSPIGNEEDIDQNEDGKLQFANRTYNAQQPNGMGYKILRKDATFASQVTDTNTIYEIRYPFVLSANFTMPAGCVLKFNGGSLSGAYTITGNGAVIGADLVAIFDTNVTLSGKWNTFDLFPEWFGAKGDGTTDDTAALQCAVNNADNITGNVVLCCKTYSITRLDLTTAHNINIIGGGKLTRGWGNDSCLKARGAIDFVVKIVGDYDYTQSVPISSTRGSSIKIEHIVIDGNNVATSGINMNYKITVIDCVVRNCVGDGIILENQTYPVYLEKVQSLFNGGNGLYARPLWSTVYAISDCEFSNNDGYGMLIEGGNTCTFKGVLCQTNKRGGVKINKTPGTSSYHSFLGNLCLISCYTEGNGLYEQTDPLYDGNFGLVIVGGSENRYYADKLNFITLLDCGFNGITSDKRSNILGTQSLTAINSPLNDIDYTKNIEQEFFGPLLLRGGFRFSLDGQLIDNLGSFNIMTKQVLRIGSTNNVQNITLGNVGECRITYDTTVSGFYFSNSFTVDSSIASSTAALVLECTNYIRLYTENLYKVVGEFYITHSGGVIKGYLETIGYSQLIYLKNADTGATLTFADLPASGVISANMYGTNFTKR